MQGLWVKMVEKPLQDMLMRYIRESALYKLIGATQETTQAQASATTVATKATEAESVVSANAVEVASGAASSASSIPYVGWILAGVAFAAVLAMVLGSKSSIKSASGGYDIPSGVNPMVQAHQDENDPAR